jgi:hypothetical protein
VALDSLPIIRDSLLPFLYCFLESIQGFSCIGIKLEFLYRLAVLQYEVIFLQTPLENHTLVSPCYIQVPTLISYTPLICQTAQLIPKARHGLTTIKSASRRPYRLPEGRYSTNPSLCIGDINHSLRVLVGPHALHQNI